MTLISGLPYFCSIVQKNLTREAQKKGSNQRFVFGNCDGSTLNRLKYLANFARSRTIYSIWGRIERCNEYESALSMKKKVFLHWVGTDVLGAKEAFDSGKFERRYISEFTHFTDAPWLVDELAEIGIVAKYLPIMGIAPIRYTEFSSPEEFGVLTYITNSQPEFYGLSTVLNLARSLPEIQFSVVGLSKTDTPLPSNVTLFGWVSDMSMFYEKNIVYLRLVKHDGMPFSVIEALARKRYVGYTYDLPGVKKITGESDLRDWIVDLKEKFVSKTLGSNDKGLDYIYSEFAVDKVYAALFTALAGN